MDSCLDPKTPFNKNKKVHIEEDQNAWWNEIQKEKKTLSNSYLLENHYSTPQPIKLPKPSQKAFFSEGYESKKKKARQTFQHTPKTPSKQYTLNGFTDLNLLTPTPNRSLKFNSESSSSNGSSSSFSSPSSPTKSRTTIKHMFSPNSDSSLSSPVGIYKNQFTVAQSLDCDPQSPIPSHKIPYKNTSRILDREYIKQICQSSILEREPPINSLQPEYLETMFADKEMIGRGSFAIVYKVKDLKDNKNYAVKVSIEAFHGEKDRRNKLEEVNIWWNIGKNDHCVQLHQAWEQDGILHLQLDLCDGGSLQDYLETMGLTSTLPEIQIWKFLLDICLGLEHVHKLNIIHLDIKPANIFIKKSKNGKLSLKIGDFGLARKCPVPPNTGLEGDRVYLAPEVLGDNGYEIAADIFSLGLILVEMASNNYLPHTGVYWQDLRKGNISLCENLNNSSPELLKLIKKMIDPNPSLRPTASEIIEIAKEQIKIYEHLENEKITNQLSKDCLMNEDEVKDKKTQNDEEKSKSSNLLIQQSINSNTTTLTNSTHHESNKLSNNKEEIRNENDKAIMDINNSKMSIEENSHSTESHQEKITEDSKEIKNSLQPSSSIPSLIPTSSSLSASSSTTPILTNISNVFSSSFQTKIPIPTRIPISTKPITVPATTLSSVEPSITAKGVTTTATPKTLIPVNTSLNHSKSSLTTSSISTPTHISTLVTSSTSASNNKSPDELTSTTIKTPINSKIASTIFYSYQGQLKNFNRIHRKNLIKNLTFHDYKRSENKENTNHKIKERRKFTRSHSLSSIPLSTTLHSTTISTHTTTTTTTTATPHTNNSNTKSSKTSKTSSTQPKRPCPKTLTNTIINTFITSIPTPISTPTSLASSSPTLFTTTTTTTSTTTMMTTTNNTVNNSTTTTTTNNNSNTTTANANNGHDSTTTTTTLISSMPATPLSSPPSILPLSQQQQQQQQQERKKKGKKVIILDMGGKGISKLKKKSTTTAATNKKKRVKWKEWNKMVEIKEDGLQKEILFCNED